MIEVTSMPVFWMLRTAVSHDGPFAFRFPRDAAPDLAPPIAEVAPVPVGTWEVLRQGRDIAVLAMGPMVQQALRAAETLAAEGIDLTVVNCRYLKPYDEITLHALSAHHRVLLTVEEGSVVNGFGAMLAAVVARVEPNVRVVAHGVPDRIIYAASRSRQLASCGLDAPGIAARVRALLTSEAVAG